MCFSVFTVDDHFKFKKMFPKFERLMNAFFQQPKITKTALTTSTILGAFILPHGAITLDPQRLLEQKDDAINSDLCFKLNKGLKQVGKEIKNELKPDLIILHTPHGFTSYRNWSIYLNNEANGTAEWLNEYSEFNIPTLRMPSSFSRKCLTSLMHMDPATDDKQLTTNFDKIDGFWTYSNAAPTLLHWGEVIPLYHTYNEYQNDCNNNNNNNDSNEYKMPDVMILSQPRSAVYRTNYNQCKNDLKLFVKKLIDFLDNKQNEYSKILFLISGDLSHTHQEKPYGYSDTAAVFDKLINSWAISGDEIFLDEAATIVNQAKPCGWIGFLLTNEMLKQLEIKYNHKPKRINIVDACHPSYYGMMVSSFLFQN